MDAHVFHTPIAASRPIRGTVAVGHRPSHAVVEREYHPEGSHISSDRFAIKLSHLGQAYLIQGTYHASVERSFSDGSAYAAFVDRVNVDRIYLYRNGSYSFVPVSKSVRDLLSRRVLDILSDPRHNPSLSDRISA